MQEQKAVYRIALKAHWENSLNLGLYHGAEVDRRDGYLHFSTAAQAAETLRLHYAAETADLVLLTIPTEGLDLKWEPSRGGQLFPHLYAPLPVGAVSRVEPIARDTEGRPILPSLA